MLVRVCLFLSLLFAATIVYAQPQDTLTTEQLLRRKGTAYAALIRPSRYLALDVNHTLGGFHRYRFFVGDELHFKAKGEKYREELYDVTDSTFSVLMANEIMNRDEPVTFQFNEVNAVYLHRRIPFISAAGTLFPIAGGVYLLADVINNRGFYSNTLPVVGALVLSGALFHLISNPHIRINKNHRLKVPAHLLKTISVEALRLMNLAERYVSSFIKTGLHLPYVEHDFSTASRLESKL